MSVCNVVVSTKTDQARKMLVFALALCSTALVSLSPAVYAAPEGGQITAGSGTIAQQGVNTTINQTSQNLAINWQGFDIGAGEAVRFNQPNSSSIALNRVLGQSSTQILGNLSANGQVFIINPNGVLFGQGAQVNVGGIVASTLDITDHDFMAGNHRFNNGGNAGKAVNKGTINADGGYVALLAPEVTNDGVIEAHMGKVVMAAGDEVSLNIDQGSLISYSVDQGTMNALVENKQLVQADGGAVYMTAKAADAIGTAVVNNTGIVEARTVQNKGGVIILGGEGADSQVTVSGTLNASASEGKGGKIVATAQRVLLDDGAKLDASGADGGGEVYVGGGWQGKDDAIRNAQAVVMRREAEIDVSAIDNGDGGTAVLWSDEFTNFEGHIAAHGGAHSGNGGQVETSGLAILQSSGSVDNTAANGEAGDWLLDPWNVIIADALPEGTVYGNPFTPTENSTILASSIVNALNSGSNVTITTGAGGGEDGNITVNADIAKTGTSASTLSLQAANDININAAISSDPTVKSTNLYGRLNVVLAADSDLSGAGNINFGSNGSVTTYHGNFIAGAGDIGSVVSRGQNMTMAEGSFIDVGNGVLEIFVDGDVTLHENSLRALNSTFSTRYYTNSNSPRYSPNANYISVRSGSGSILTANNDAGVADILTSADTRLHAGTIGTSLEPIKISGPDDPYGLIAAPEYNTNTFNTIGRTLSVSNTSGSSYIEQMGVQIFKTVDVMVGSQLNAVQNIQIMGDPGGTGTDGTGHIIVTNDGDGITVIGTGDINTVGVPGTNTGNWATSTDPSVFSTNVSLTANHLMFENNSVNTGGNTSYFYQGVGSYYRQGWGMSNYSSYFSASAPTIESANPDNTVDIHALTLNLTGAEIGTVANPLDIGSGSTLNINNTGGSTFVESEDNTFSTINLTNVKAVGTHYVHFSGGDHIDYLTDGDKVYVPTIALNGCAVTDTCGMDVTQGGRTISMTAHNGDIVFANDAVNTRTGSFTATLSGSNNEGNILAEHDYDDQNQVAQITAANVTFNVQNNSAPGTIGGGDKHIQIAQGTGASNNTLTVNTQQGDVNIHELTNNHFKTLNVTLSSASAAQDIVIDLNGADDVNFSDDGTLVTIDATKVNLSDNNRNWNLNTPSRTIQIDSTSIGSGNYTVNAGQRLRLDGDVVTNDGAIDLRGGSGIDLLRSVSVDSNSDNIGSSGSIYMSGMISGATNDLTFTADSHSTDGSGGLINMYSGANNGAGSYLSAFALVSSGAAANGTQDGAIYIRNSSYAVDGNFLSTGNSFLQGSLTIDTEQGNDGHAGDIIFAGRNVNSTTSYTLNLNTSTSAAGMNAGSVNLYGTLNPTTFTARALTITATGGAGGEDGAISLPAVSTTVNGGANTQSYTGGIITLHGDLRTDRGAVTLDGDTRLATNVTIDTWSAPTNVQTGTGGAVNISGTGVSANAAGYGLTIDTGTNTGGGYFNPPTNTTNFNQSGGAVSLVAGNAGGHYLNTINVNTKAGGTQNDGTHGTIALHDVGTVDAQTYSGGALTLNGDISTNGGLLTLSDLLGITLVGDSSLKTDRAGGDNDAGGLNLGSNAINGAFGLFIDLTADGEGAAQDFTTNMIGNVTPLASLDIMAQNLTVGASAETSGNMTLEAHGETSDFVLDDIVTSDSGLITLVAGRDFINNNVEDTGIVTNTGRYLVYSTHPDDTLEGMTGYSKHYNQTYTRGLVPDYANADNWFLYAYQPMLLVKPDSLTIPFGEALAGVTYSYSGLIDGDLDAGVSGSPLFTAGAEPGVQNIVYVSGLLSAMGYGFTDNPTSLGELTILPRPNATPGTNTVGGLPNGDKLIPVYTAAINTATTSQGGNNSTEPANQQTDNAGSSLNIAMNIDSGNNLQIGTVTVENGGMRLPGDIQRTFVDGNDNNTDDNNQE